MKNHNSQNHSSPEPQDGNSGNFQKNPTFSKEEIAKRESDIRTLFETISDTILHAEGSFMQIVPGEHDYVEHAAYFVMPDGNIVFCAESYGRVAGASRIRIKNITPDTAQHDGLRVLKDFFLIAVGDTVATAARHTMYQSSDRVHLESEITPIELPNLRKLSTQLRSSRSITKEEGEKYEEKHAVDMQATSRLALKGLFKEHRKKRPPKR